ncbi:MAG: hypothetical protein LDL33_15060 [Desulfomonile sp.]|nr:hypothetical protein [Desulfomonile sp.]
MKQNEPRSNPPASPKLSRTGSLLSRIFTSTLFALLVLTVAAISLAMLYFRGRTLEAGVGTALLIVAAFLIYRGSQAPRADDE